MSVVKKIAKWTGVVFGVFILIAATTALFINYQWNQDASKMYEVSDAGITIPEPDSVILARGKRVSELFHCTGCHLPTFAGEDWDVPAFMGSVNPSNLTRGEGGIGNDYTDEDWIRAIRHGIKPDGTSLVVMPTEEFVHIGKEDLEALVAYLKTVPPVDHIVAPNTFKVAGKLMITLTMDYNMFSASRIDHSTPISAVPVKAVNLEYGGYLTQTCKSCHGTDLKGQALPGDEEIMSTDLLALTDWTNDDFGRAIREGLRPNGDTLLVNMPRWTVFDDEDVDAIWLYLNHQKDNAFTGGTEAGF